MTRSTTAAGPASIDPKAYVDSIWNAQLLPAVRPRAVDARTLLDALAASPEAAAARYGHREANGPAYFVVKGEGMVTSVDTRSRSGLALVDVAPFDRRPDLSIQIGPVLRGTVLARCHRHRALYRFRQSAPVRRCGQRAQRSRAPNDSGAAGQGEPRGQLVTFRRHAGRGGEGGPAAARIAPGETGGGGAEIDRADAATAGDRPVVLEARAVSMQYPGHAGPGSGHLPAAPRPGLRAHRGERRGQIHAGEDPGRHRATHRRPPAAGRHRRSRCAPCATRTPTGSASSTRN